MINKLTYHTKIIEYLFPKFCVGCSCEGVWLCEECRKGILLVESQVCPECKRISQDGRYCSKCRKNKNLKGIICAAYFEEGPLKEIIHNFKYNSVLELEDILTWGLKNSLKNWDLSEYIISFTPLHSKRFAQRGYNQSEILAKSLGLETYELLEKKKNTKRQVGLIGNKRRKNLKGVFGLKKNVDVRNKKIIIVDDITTTGTTLEECAKVLKENGAKEAWGLVVARG